eukprot:TRINITY_DN8772_c0_g1_i1.p1 TRINITY_DN8772_c0_g1~~TRINITY_DN8772_c0_g1_i1.p1  ORF type:complete len:281 (-),score=90.58 TRINITY_DN8772_c0_g1_i1:206-994(-)
MFKFYSPVVGLKYLWLTLAKLINELNALSADSNSPSHLNPDISILTANIEVDPSKLESGDINTNKLELQLIAHKFLTAILHSSHNFPTEFRIIVAHLKKVVSAQFPQHKMAPYTAIGGFIFLRLICPALIAPHNFGLLQAAPNKTCQRKLILISKLMQNLANGVHFGNKEPFMASLNDFITTNKDPLYNWFDSLTEIPTSSMVIQEVPRVVRRNAVAFLHWLIINNLETIKTRLCVDQEGKQLFVDLNQELDNFGPPQRFIQ